MKYVDEFRDAGLAQGVAAKIAVEADASRVYRFMEFCGGHTHAISRYGVEDLLPANVQMIHGPGCPVCVLPIGRIDDAIKLAADPSVTLCTYADLMRVPASRGASLMKARAAGADIRMVYSTLDALRIAESEPHRQVVFFAIGFETTTPPTALALLQARSKGLPNFTVFCNHVLTPAAMRGILNGAGADDAKLCGIVGPAHVSTVIGVQPYEFVASEFHTPVVISGFEPLDVMQSILMLLRQANAGRCEIENQYARAVSRHGNVKAKAAMAEVFEMRESFEWRGLGQTPRSALRLRDAFGEFDAERRFNVATAPAADNPACECGAILRGAKKPTDCKLFGALCTPETPMGSCMVSSEGSCAAHFAYGRFRDRAKLQRAS
jgi:hydrogenase expression/formation protein HypD